MKLRSWPVGFLLACMLPLSLTRHTLAQGPFGPALDEYTKGEKAEARKEGGIPNYKQLERIAGAQPENAGLQVFNQMTQENEKRRRARASQARNHSMQGLKRSCEQAARVSAKYGLGESSGCSQYDTQQDQQSDAEQLQDNINQAVAYGALAIGIMQAFQHKAVESPQQKAAREAQLRRVHDGMDKARAANQRLQQSAEGLRRQMAALKALEGHFDSIDNGLKKHRRPDPKLVGKMSEAMARFNKDPGAPVLFDKNKWNPYKKLETFEKVPPPPKNCQSWKSCAMVKLADFENSAGGRGARYLGDAVLEAAGKAGPVAAGVVAVGQRGLKAVDISRDIVQKQADLETERIKKIDQLRGLQEECPTNKCRADMGRMIGQISGKGYSSERSFVGSAIERHFEYGVSKYAQWEATKFATGALTKFGAGQVVKRGWPSHGDLTQGEIAFTKAAASGITHIEKEVEYAVEGNPR